MKIIIVDHNKQFRLIPDSALLLKNRPLFCPDYVQALHAKVALVMKINRLGKYIQEKFAPTYYDEIGFAINFYDKNCLKTLIQQGFPWERATCFDGSFVLSEFVKLSEVSSRSEILCSKNNNEIQVHLFEQTIREIPSIISELSTYMTLKIGDYIAFELGEWLTSIAMNDVLRLSVDDNQMINVVVK
ncbi:MAG: fumarylacetoacetate hydrolase family protein [Bacteroidales bacterium]|jgi:2-keto-4-pentenoate hydratase/2-oxohepta-3-ene-1,7-dioic acid hydratase in catechol pathway|nr:fumarylacetoacetate hydrolase family protein [Bacteroidales bacterium]